MRGLALLALGAVACAQPTEGAWLTGFGYGWVGFNHRVSYNHFVLSGDEALVSVVGGTSTTGVEPVLDDACDPDACGEYPIRDDSEVRVEWARASSDTVVFATQGVTLTARAAGERATIEVPLPKRARAEATAWIAGLVIDTDHPTALGETCYDPAYGWHPRRIAVALEQVTLDPGGRSVSLAVDVAFAAGSSLEPIRECVDAVAAEARVPITVYVQVVAGDLDLRDDRVEHDLAYSWGCEEDGGLCFSPDPQPDPDHTERRLAAALGGTVSGWTAMDFRFHVDHPDARGAYLRTFSVGLDPEGRWASGHATNFSPVTQTSGFDYTFIGRVSGIANDVEVTRGVVDAALETSLDAQGRPTVHRLPL